MVWDEAFRTLLVFATVWLVSSVAAADQIRPGQIVRAKPALSASDTVRDGIDVQLLDWHREVSNLLPPGELPLRPAPKVAAVAADCSCASVAHCEYSSGPAH